MTGIVQFLCDRAFDAWDCAKENPFPAAATSITGTVALTRAIYSQREAIRHWIRPIVNLSRGNKVFLAVTASVLTNLRNLYSMVQSKKEGMDVYDRKRNLIWQARREKLEPIVGREQIISDVIVRLLCCDRSHVLLAGPSGVGKTAIAKGVALQIVKNKDQKLKNKTLLCIDLPDYTAREAIWREKEKEIRLLLEELEQNKNLRVIACTTDKDSAISKEADFRRHFDAIEISEPSEKDLQAIVAEKGKIYANHHGCEFKQEAINKAIDLSNNTLSKALRLLDLAGSRAQLKRQKTVTADDIE